MKRFVKASMMLTAVALSGSAMAAPISVTGYNADIVAEPSNLDILDVTTNGVIPSQGWTIITQGYTGEGAVGGTPLVVTNDTVTTQDGTVFAIDGDADNALIGNGTLSLVTPAQYQDLQFLLWMVSGDVTATVNFDDATTAVLQQNGISDWQGSNTFNAFPASDETPSVRRSNDQKITLNFRQLNFTLDPADQVKTIESIDFNFSSGTRNSIVAVSGTATIPSPSAAIAGLVGLGGICMRRRRK